MHEISAAHGVLEAMMEEAGRHGLSRVVSARVTVNAVDGLSPENVAYWVGVLGEGTCVQGAVVEVYPAAGPGEDCPPPGTVRLDELRGVPRDDVEYDRPR
ncbi:MAG: hypothetical protein HPY55_15080 [Firmicutes bacterium]|nr:hypothetical protein [Bacillota bacterium]